MTSYEVYHGSANTFTAFSETTLGKGEDAYGAGYYFTTNKDTAEGYGTQCYKATVTLNNPIQIDGTTMMNLNHIRLKPDVVVRILRYLPHVYNQPTDDEVSPIGDLLPVYWDADQHPKETLDQMLDVIAYTLYADANLTQLYTLFGDDPIGANAFCKALLAETEWDGVVITFKRETHVVAWSIDQIHITEHYTA